MHVTPRREPSPYSKWERRGSAVAHASALLVGIPVILLQFLPLPFAFLANPLVAYLIARSFRRRRMAWGAFQGMQASVVHLIILALVFIPALTVGFSPLMAAILFTAALVLFLYTLWGAWDTLLGYNFRYIGISNFLDRVSQANLQRVERRRGLFQPYRTDRDDKPPS
jgi:fatty acid desaturase